MANIDPGGRTVTPGFIDAHLHTASSGLRHLKGTRPRPDTPSSGTNRGANESRRDALRTMVEESLLRLMEISEKLAV